MATGVDEKGKLIETKKAFAGSAADLKGLLEFLCTDKAHSARAREMGRFVGKKAGGKKKKARASHSLEVQSISESVRSQTALVGKREDGEYKAIQRIDKMQVSRLNWESEEEDREAAFDGLADAAELMNIAENEELRKSQTKDTPYDQYGQI